MVNLLEAAVVRSCLGKNQMIMYCAIIKLTFAFFLSISQQSSFADYSCHYSKDSRWWEQHEHLVEENVQLKPRSFCVPLNWKANVGGIQFNSNKQLLPSFLQKAS